MKNITKHIVYALMLLVICINFISIASASPFLEYYSSSIDDDNSGSSSGNSNNKINPEEIIEITVKIENNGNTDVSGVTGQLRLKRSNPHVTIIDDDASYGTIGLNERKEGTFIFHVSDVQENSIYESISFEIILTDSSGNTWTDSFTKYVDFPSITVTPTETSTSDSTDTDVFDSTVIEISDSDDSNLNPYFPLEIGRQWTYVWSNDKYHPEEIIEEMEFTEIIGDEYYFKISGSRGSSGIYSINEQKDLNNNLQTLVQGREGSGCSFDSNVLWWSIFDLLTCPHSIIKYPLEIGETWSEDCGFLIHDIKVKSHIEGFETIDVMSGTYPNSLKIKTEFSSPHDSLSGTRYMWFAKNVGLVKLIHYHDDGSISDLQLKIEDIETYNFPPSIYTIDGYSNDWFEMKTIVTDPKGDGVNDVSGTDIKAVYADSDENYLYLMMEFWDGPTNPHLNDYEMIESNHYSGNYKFYLITDDDEDKDKHERRLKISLFPSRDYSKGLDETSYIYEMSISKYNPNLDEECFLYDSTGYSLGIDNSKNVLYVCEDVIEIQIPWDVLEIHDFIEMRGSVNVAYPIDVNDENHDDFRDRTDYGKYISSSSFKITDFKDLSSFIIKLQNAQDPLSQYLRDQFSEDTLRLLDEYNRQDTPSEALRRALVDELNRILKSGSLYDEQMFENIELSDELLELIEDNPQGQDLIELNRLLLEEAYPQEIEKYKIKTSEHIPGFMGFSLIISILFIWSRRKFA